ncbi:hypothetical protein ANN_03051 [Periplaneta americana]|uniref:Uncharacterized protein n=1 Tax=Periplaneta americana TaxID=6978 RepID=A0ABQ8TZM2_PERAM|nr:hypothetical protein ANN_03051 [Periplaneta americana]
MNDTTKDHHVQKVRYEPCRVKAMLIVAYDSEGVIISHAVSQDQNLPLRCSPPAKADESDERVSNSQELREITYGTRCEKKKAFTEREVDDVQPIRWSARWTTSIAVACPLSGAGQPVLLGCGAPTDRPPLDLQNCISSERLLSYPFYPTHLFYQCGHSVLVTLGCINIHSRGGRGLKQTSREQKALEMATTLVQALDAVGREEGDGGLDIGRVRDLVAMGEKRPPNGGGGVLTAGLPPQTT